MTHVHSLYPLAVHIIFIKDKQILLSRRMNTGYEDGKFSLVAGHVDFCESIISACIREAKEEVGVSIEPENVSICGSMHRKSEDERIDFFAIINQWEGQLANCEPQKCSELKWVDWNKLPVDTIPYIRRAVELTRQNNEIWYEEYGWNTYRYLEKKRKENILRKRGLGDNLLDFGELLHTTIKTIGNIDDNLFPSNDSQGWKAHLRESILSGKIVVGTPILQNIQANAYNDLAACSIISLTLDSDGNINYDKLQTDLEDKLNHGTGVGIDLSSASNPEEEVDRIDKLILAIDDKLLSESRRPAAAILTLRSSHPHIKEFIRCRIGKNTETTRINTSVFIDSDHCANLFPNIAESIAACGEPGILFSEIIDKDNSTPQWKYESMAPCAEVAMCSSDACHFSYINIAKFIKDDFTTDWSELKNTIYTITRFMDDVVEFSITHDKSNCYHLVEQKRRIGIGIVGFATALIKMGIAYNSPEGLEYARRIVDCLSIYTKKSSVELAKTRGSFPAFKESQYVKREWLNEKAQHISTSTEKEEIINNILQFGIRNSTTLAFPPTGMSSIIAGVSTSFEPYLEIPVTYQGHTFIPAEITEYISKRYKKDEGIIISQLLRKEIDLSKYPEFVSSNQVTADYQLKYTRIFQNASDGSASKTVNLPSDTSIDAIQEHMQKAKDLKLKGVTFYINQIN